MRNHPVGILLADLKRFASKERRRVLGHERRVWSQKPRRRQVGNVLLCYNSRAFFLKRGTAIPHDHTSPWESWQIATTFLQKGFGVDVIDEENDMFVPTREYQVFVGNRINFVRIARLLNADCVKILHIDSSHWMFHNMAEYRRIEALRARRGICLPAQRTMNPNLAIEHADYAIALGNEATISTYRYAQKPIFRVPISAPTIYDWCGGKDFELVRRRFLWFGSHGFIHKGLDIVLEAFAQMPEYHLTVCGPMQGERDFQRAYQKELYETTNIRTVGWVDAAGVEVQNIARNCLGVVFPSCSEGGGGSVITCMHLGLIPIVSHEASVDVDETHGVLLRNSCVEEIRAAVCNLSARAPEILAAMARKNWEVARARHTRDTFATCYANVISTVLTMAGLLL
jgi:glycosyltransferase involved in cell wall biosynthesis